MKSEGLELVKNLSVSKLGTPYPGVPELKHFIPYSEKWKILIPYIDSNSNTLFTMIYQYILWLIPAELQTVDSNADVDSNLKQWVLLMFPSLYSIDYYWSGTVVLRRNKYTKMHLLAIQLYMIWSYSWQENTYENTKKLKEPEDSNPNSFQVSWAFSVYLYVVSTCQSSELLIFAFTLPTLCMALLL